MESSKKYDVIIIGAGTSGLTARREVMKKTDNYLVVHDGPFGTTCARVGCMPSKVLIQVANDFNQQQKLLSMGLIEADNLKVNRKLVMDHVRSLRDRFVRGVLSSMPEWEDKLIKGRASFVNNNTIEVNGAKYTADKIILATGSSPSYPQSWLKYKKYFLDTDLFFEQKDFPGSILVIGLGVIGFELGQALSRLGANVTGVIRSRSMGGLTDPVIQDYVYKKLNDEFKVYEGGADIVGESDGGQLIVKLNGEEKLFDKVILSVGRVPNIKNIGIENTSSQLNSKNIPIVNFKTMAIKGAPHIFLPGDVNGLRPILHEAADEGRIAGYNSVNELSSFKRRMSMGVTFSDPNIASVGQTYRELSEANTEFITGKVSFEGQGRSIVKLKEQGLMHVYVEKKSGTILGAELQAPEGEHLAHLLAWVMSLNLTVFEALRLPFYHPVIEEGLRTALRDAARQVKSDFTEIEKD